MTSKSGLSSIFSLSPYTDEEFKRLSVLTGTKLYRDTSELRWYKQLHCVSLLMWFTDIFVHSVHRISDLTIEN